MTGPTAGHPGLDPGSSKETIYRSAPTLERERLRLRAWQKADFRPWLSICGEPAVTHHFGGKPMAAEDVFRRLTASLGSWILNGFGSWAVERRSDGRLIGNVGLFTAWRDLQPEFGEEPEMGWIFATEAHGQGLALEAGRAVLDWAEASLRPTPIWAIIAPANTPSFRLAERLGFERHSDTLYKEEPTAVLRRPAWS
ncbi:GNAT family N-acetyltransferase [uncultured Sphingomonas sp.]|uniref:GNAT family N-acetyltransferase n=1 Tax=uncultured Sphingomonas sp. TaxID=158754 RepID=UPI0025ED9AE8|nr:GNAT family N-acetyltransferase [uncultured Sphingomonas sp.]